MRRTRTHRRRRATTRKIEHRQWFTTSGRFHASVTLKTGADTANVVKVAVDPLKGDDQTILRTRGFVIPQLAGLTENVIGVLGGIVLPNKTAQNASASELPNPLVDADSTDWFVWHPWMLPATGDQQIDQDTITAAEVNLPIDSKAKRIMEASDSVVWILGFNSDGAQSNKSMFVSYCLRSLVGY